MEQPFSGSKQARTVAAKTAYADMAWGAETMGWAFGEMMNAGTVLTEVEMRKRALAHGSFVDGAKLGFLDILDSQVTWARFGEQAVSNMYSILERGTSDFVFTMLTDAQDIGKVWEDLTGNILRMFANMLAQMAVQMAASTAINFLTGGMFTVGGGVALQPVTAGVSPITIGSVAANVGGWFGAGTAASAIPTAGITGGAFGIGVPAGTTAVTGGAVSSGAGAAAVGLGPYLALAAPVLLGMYLGSKRGRPMTEAERYQEEISRFVQGINNELRGPSGGDMMLSAEDLGARLRRSGLDDEQRYQAAKRVSIGNLVNIEGSLIADESTFNDFVDQIDLRLYQIGQLETGT